MTKQEISKAILATVAEYNSNLDTPVDLSAGSESVLFGQGSSLASIDFVSLIVDIEDAIECNTGKSITLADARAMSQKNSPFRTVGTLAEYIESRLKEQGNE